MCGSIRVLGSSDSERAVDEGLIRLAVVIGSCSAARFNVTITSDERMELDWLASLKALARSLISWISVRVSNELNVAENFGASLLDTSSISIIPLLSQPQRAV